LPEKKTFVFSKEKLLAGGAIYYAAAPIYLPFVRLISPLMSRPLIRALIGGAQPNNGWWAPVAQRYLLCCCAHLSAIP
jgi:hypothetical protein